MTLPFDIGSLVLPESEAATAIGAGVATPPHPTPTLTPSSRLAAALLPPPPKPAATPAIEATDAELMLRIGAGDQHAFILFARRHAPRCHAVAMHLLRNAADAEEAVQDALLRVWKNAEKWRPSNARVSTWLYRVVVNLCLDQMRRTERLSLSIEHAAEVIANDPGPESEVGQRELIRVVARATAALPPRQRAALALIVQGLDCAQAAAAMQVSVGTMESLLVRARRQLRAVLAEAVQGRSAARDQPG